MPSEREAGTSKLIPHRFSELSAPGRVLVSIMRDAQFGRFEDLRVHNGEPVFDPPPRLIRVKRIGSTDEPTVSASDDWVLKGPILDLLWEIAAIGNGTVARLEFRKGQPCLLEWVIPATSGTDGGGEGRLL